MKRPVVMNKNMASTNDCGNVDDASLIRAYAKGDEKAFETLYYRYRKQLYGYLNNLAGNNSAEVDEVFAETWLRVIEKLPKYQDSGKFSAWLYRISRNIFIDRLRHNKPDKFVTIDADDSAELAETTAFSPDRELGSGEIGKAIASALDKLQPEQREVFLLREEAELSFKEIAEIQSCSLGTVLSRMRYALKRLRMILRNIDSGGLLK
ncbi:MAG: sigma-70 family RNA polymerase sigma factor [Lentisphaerae bacterium]|nr:sigma-70 family RNA polymerase sigma factor [Lentisphaerota bacterium]